MQSLTAPADLLRVACDARCLADGEVRGFARYTIELLSALRRRDDVEVFLVTDTPLELPPPLVGLDIRTIASGRECRGLPAVRHISFSFDKRRFSGAPA